MKAEAGTRAKTGVKVQESAKDRGPDAGRCPVRAQVLGRVTRGRRARVAPRRRPSVDLTDVTAHPGPASSALDVEPALSCADNRVRRALHAPTH